MLQHQQVRYLNIASVHTDEALKRMV